MFRLFDISTTGGSLLLLLVALSTSGVVCDNAKIIPAPTTASPPAGAAHAAAKPPPVAGTGKPDAGPAPPKHVEAAKIATHAPAPAGPGPLTTTKPAAAHVKPNTNAPVAPAAAHVNIAHAGTAVPVAAAAADQGPGKKLALYFEPICMSLDKLANEHMFKVQGQLKSFIEKTAGKMSVCFMQQYLMDPNLTPVDKAQLKIICSSQTLAADNKNSFKSFQHCAANNWDKNLDIEIDRINKLRLNCFFNHTHSKNDSTVNLVHESDELSIIGEVVGKVLNDNKANSNITMINLGGKPTGTPANGAAANNKAAPSVAPKDQAAVSKKLLNDPNTVLVIVNDSPTSGPAPAKATAPGAPHPPPPPPPPPPVAAAPPAPPAQSAPPAGSAPPTPPAKAAVPPPPQPPASKAPAAAAAEPTHKPGPPTVVAPAAGPATTVKPAGTTLGEKIIAAATTGLPKPPATTSPPKANASSTAPSTNDKIAAGVALSTAKPAAAGQTPAASTPKPAASTLKPAGTTSKPAAISTTGHPASTGPPGTTSKPQPAEPTKAAASTSKPQSTPAAASAAAQEKDKADAKEAIKSLQAQKAGHVSDARLHQLEHDRQMAIDPEGHTDKHKKYEQLKQQRTSKAPTTTATPTNKKAE